MTRHLLGSSEFKPECWSIMFITLRKADIFLGISRSLSSTKFGKSRVVWGENYYQTSEKVIIISFLPSVTSNLEGEGDEI